MPENTTLALLPLVLGMLVLLTRFYFREGAISVFSVSFMLATLAMLMLFGYLALAVLAMLPPYAWVVCGGLGTAMIVGGLFSFLR